MNDPTDVPIAGIIVAGIVYLFIFAFLLWCAYLALRYVSQALWIVLSGLVGGVWRHFRDRREFREQMQERKDEMASPALENGANGECVGSDGVGGRGVAITRVINGVAKEANK